MKLAARLRKLGLAVGYLLLGLGLGVVALEVVLRVNPTLLPKGVSPIAALDPPLVTQTYDVYYSDGDSFLWNPELIRPLTAQDNKVQAHVVFQTDELGFPNRGPLPPTVFAAVVGRSYSIGSQTDVSWVQDIQNQTHWSILNLSEIGSGNDLKLNLLRQYAFARQPRWIIVEVLPLMDVIGYGHAPPFLLPQLPTYIVKGIWSQINKAQPAEPQGADPIYPMRVSVDQQTFPVVFSTHEMDALTVPPEDVLRSRQWALFTADLLAIQAEAKAHSACVAILYAQSKTGAYLPLLADSAPLKAARTIINPYTLDEDGNLVQRSGPASGPGATIPLAALQRNAEGMRALIADFARAHAIPFIDPTDLMRDSLRAGRDPFMAYDSHLSRLGHELVAEKTIDTLHTLHTLDTLQQAACG